MTEKNHYRELFVGTELTLPVLQGHRKLYINFDNAASTPPLKSVQSCVNDFLMFYSSVHRGTGYKSQLSTHLYEQARQITLDYLGANHTEHTCIFVKNTTEAINKLARRFPFSAERNVVLTSGMEHHSNDLPWRANTHTIHINLTKDGRLDEGNFEQLLEKYADRVALVAITGASNVTGFLNPIYRMAEKAHQAGALIAVDCAQLAPHRKVNMRSLEDHAHLDFVTISAHKMYAPYGSGALVGRRDIFEHGEPDVTGGGTVEIVTLDSVIWAEPPYRDEAGSPNTVGVVALAAAIRQLESIGMDKVAEHEAELTAHALNRFAEIPEVMIYGDSDPKSALNRLGVIPFRLKGMIHFKVAAILGHEFGIGVRSGCFCAHPYILHLLQVDHAEAEAVRQQMLAGDRSNMPGMIRASFGLYNTIEEVDALVDALNKIIHGEFTGEYIQDTSTGEFVPRGWEPAFDSYLNI
jgi:selenocysteine lyase/cysteine desulfurase